MRSPAAQAAPWPQVCRVRWLTSSPSCGDSCLIGGCSAGSSRVVISAAVRRQRNIALLPFCDKGASAQHESPRHDAELTVETRDLSLRCRSVPRTPSAQERAPAEVSDHATQSPIERNVWFCRHWPESPLAPRGTATSICTASHRNRQSDVRGMRGRRPNWPATVTSAIVEATNHGAQQPPPGRLLLHEHTQVPLLVEQREPRGLALTTENDRDRGAADTEVVKFDRIQPWRQVGFVDQQGVLGRAGRYAQHRLE